MSTLGDYLISRGFDVDDTPVLGRTATWDRVRYVTVHHFVGSETVAAIPAQVDFLKHGKEWPPNSQLYLDIEGTVHVITRQRPGQHEPGRATHMGAGTYPGIPRDRGNEMALGIECQNTGYHPIADNQHQYGTLIRLCAALVDRYQLTPEHVIGHKEYNPGKVDPRDNMDTIRRDVRRAWSEPSPPPTTEPDVTPADVWNHPLEIPEDARRDGDPTHVPAEVMLGWANRHALAALEEVRRLRDQLGLE